MQANKLAENANLMLCVKISPLTFQMFRFSPYILCLKLSFSLIVGGKGWHREIKGCSYERDNLLAFLEGFDSSKGGKSLTLQKLGLLSFMFV